MTWHLLILAVFAAYRVGLMVSQEEGPFSVFRKLRDSLTDDKDWLAIGLRCCWCVSFWAALPIALVLAAAGPFTEQWLWPLVWFGIAGGAVLIDKIWKR